MPISLLDKKAALIIIDLQKGIVALPMAHPANDIVARSAELARVFRERGLPVVLVNVTAATSGRTDAGAFRGAFPDGWMDLVPELNQQPDDHLVSKQRVGAFLHTGLDEWLHAQGVTQVFVAGIATGSGVESTMREARDRGYNVVAVIDAMTDRDAETHNFCIQKVFPRLSETGTTADVLTLLQSRASLPDAPAT